MERNHKPGPGLLGGVSGWQHDKSWTSSQKKPYLNPLPYRRSVLANSPGFDWGGLSMMNFGSEHYARLGPVAYARAYDRFYKQVGEKAEMLMNLAEMSSSIKMATQRCRQIVDICQALRRGKVGDVFSFSTGLYGASVSDTATVKSKTKKRVRSMSEAYLETAFGWLPIAQDLKAVCDILSRDFDNGTVKARSTVYQVIDRVQRGRTSWDNDIVESYGGASYVRCEVGGQVVVTNPNAFLLNQLGIANPGAFLWDNLPGSFMVDWFVPVGKYLRSLSNDFGAEVHRGYITHSVNARLVGQYFDTYGSSTFFFMERSPVGSLPKPDLLSRARLPEADLWHLATTAALATQSLTSLFR